MRFALALFFAALLSIFAQAEKRAFIVGVGEYENLTDLRKTIGDAQGYAGLFENELGYQVTQLTNPTRSQFAAGFGGFLDQIKRGDEVVFVFSGHGWSDGGDNFLVMSDAPKEASEFELKTETMALSAGVLDQIKRRNPALTFAIVDACREHPFDNMTRNGFGRGLVRTDVHQGTLVLYSAGTRQKALDRLSNSDPSPYSVFTRVLLPKLRQTKKPLQDIAREVKSEVRDLAGSIDHQQFPAYYDELLKEYCLGGECAQGGGLSNPSPTPVDQDLVDWNRLKGLGPTGLNAYLALHPSGQFTQEAQRLLQASSDAPPPDETEPAPGVAALVDAGMDAFSALDYTKASTEWKRACDQGGAVGCAYLGYMYAEGFGVEQDYAKAAQLYERGCNGGSGHGCLNLASQIEYGYAYNRDVTKAAQFSRLSCELGEAAGCTKIGLYFAQGLGVSQNVQQASQYFKSGCDGGHAAGCTRLGDSYEYGFGLPQNYYEAGRYFNAGCEWGDPEGCTKMAILYAKGAGFEVNLTEARRLYQLGCEGGNAMGCSGYGYALYTGSGGYQDLANGSYHIKSACSNGDSWGCELMTNFGITF